MRPVKSILVSTLLSLLSAGVSAGEWDLGAEVGGELRTFFEEAPRPEQFDTLQPSLLLTGDVRYTFDNRRHKIVFVPYARLDAQDQERTHFDLREAYYRYAGREVEVLVGVAKVFWGVTESRHLVDIVNQTDAVEDIDEEDKLGQPMVKLTLLKSWGQLDLFVLPYFRERPFPGRDGRLRFGLVIDTDQARYEDGDRQWNTDFAVRYSKVIGDWDIGVTGFSGNSREPVFELGTGADDQPVIVPVYTKINQGGLDIQYTKDAWLFKFEGIVREGQGDLFAATVAGFEYTFYGITDSGADLGILMEHLYDGRDTVRAPVTVQDNDLFLGARLALNDTQDTSILAGTITDLEDGSSSGLVEAERRFGNSWKGEVEARFFFFNDEDNVSNAFKDESLITVRMTRFF